MAIYVADKPTLDAVLSIAQRLDANIMNAQTMDWGAYFSARATGELFSTKFYYQSVTDTDIGEKLNDSVGRVCEPSTDTVKGRDDFAVHNAFWFVDCNFVVDDSGMKIPTFIDGQSGFKRTGNVDVGVLTPPLYWGEEMTADGYIKHFSDKPNPRPGMNLTLMPHCRDMYGNPMPYGIVTKYYAGKGTDGLLYSASGMAVCNFISFESGHTELQKKGTGYLGSGSERTAYLKNFLWIKYAVSSSQKKFQGNTNYNLQYANAAPGTEVNYVTLTKAQANGIYIGTTVSIGECTNTENIDRGNGYMRNLADKVKVTKKEDVDDTYSRVYVDSPAFDTTTSTYISTMPLHSGQTDAVLGNDGQITNDGKHSFKIQGVEEGIGAYYVSMNEALDKETPEKTTLYRRTSAAWSNVANTIKETWEKIGSCESVGSADFWIGEEDVDLETGSSVPRTVGSGSATGTGDRYYYGGNGTGFRENLERGYLGVGSFAGLSYRYGGGSLSGSSWYCALCV